MGGSEGTVLSFGWWLEHWLGIMAFKVVSRLGDRDVQA